LQILIIKVNSHAFVCRRIPAADGCGSEDPERSGLAISSTIDSGDFSDLT